MAASTTFTSKLKEKETLAEGTMGFYFAKLPVSRWLASGWRIARVRWMLIGNVCCSLSACFATPVWFDHCCQNGSAVSLSF